KKRGLFMNAQAKNITALPSALLGEERVQALDWEQISQDLDTQGSAVLEHLIPADECQRLSALYVQDELFRSHIVMARHGFGRGEYKYFAYPLPTVIADLRSALYACLVPIANSWEASLSSNIRYPDEHADLPLALPRSWADQTDATALA